MNRRSLPIILAVLTLAPAALRADDLYTNRFTLSARFGFNVSAKFGGVRGLTAPASGSAARTTPGGDQYNYDNGYVLTDVSGNFGNQTWYWGYDDSSKQISGNSILLSKSTFAGSSPSVNADGDVSPGFELAYNRPLLSWGRLLVGFEVAGNFMNVSLHNSRATAATVHRTTDTYDFTPGTTPPAATPAAPYQGSFEGPGFVIGSTPSSSSSSDVVGGATIIGERTLDANVWGARLGPNLELPLGQRFKIAASGGLAAALVDADVTWSESVHMNGARGPTLSGSGSASGFELGFYVGATATYSLSERWDLVGGAQYQYLDNFRHNFGGRDVNLDFSQTILVTIGVGFKF
jgi:hypothetical protein